MICWQGDQVDNSLYKYEAREAWDFIVAFLIVRS